MCNSQMSTMMALEQPILKHEINDWKQFCCTMDQDKLNCDLTLTQLANNCLTLRLNINSFANSIDNTNLIMIDNIRRQCLISSLNIEDCIETIVYLSTRLSVLPTYTQYYRQCEQIVAKHRKILKDSRKRFDETMIALTSQ